MVVIGWASEMTAMSLEGKATPGWFKLKPGFRTKLVMPVPGPGMGANDMDDDGMSGSKRPVLGSKAQCAAVRIVRELISEPVQNEPPAAGLNRLTTLGNWLPASK